MISSTSWKARPTCRPYSLARWQSVGQGEGQQGGQQVRAVARARRVGRARWQSVGQQGQSKGCVHGSRKCR